MGKLTNSSTKITNYYRSNFIIIFMSTKKFNLKVLKELFTEEEINTEIARKFKNCLYFDMALSMKEFCKDQKYVIQNRVEEIYKFLFPYKINYFRLFIRNNARLSRKHIVCAFTLEFKVPMKSIQKLMISYNMGRLHPRCNEMFFNTIITEWSPKIKNVFRNEGVRNSSIETVKYSISG